MNTESTPPPTYHIGLTYDLLKTALQDRLRANNLDITAEQLAILRLLNQHNCVPIKFISEHTFRDSSTVTRIIDNLQKKKLLKRVPSKVDRRVKHICISDLGIETYTKAAEVARQHVALAMKGIDTDDIDKMIETLNQIQLNIKNQIQ